ncbi:MAG TPA: hypothetical protein PKD55_18545 [Bellilinea sp.]|nr:hypothetical protein [Bellilinea sp.]
MDLWQRLRRLFRHVQDEGEVKATWQGREAPALPEPIFPRVMVLTFDPYVGSRTLSESMGWNRVDDLVAGYIADLCECSHGYLNYRVVEQVHTPTFPPKYDGYEYTVENYLRFWKHREGFHQPDLCDYGRILEEHGLLERMRENKVDEVWMFAMPWGGFYESMMVGPGAFFVNAPGRIDRSVSRNFILMGFNPERGVGEMLEGFGHRAESILNEVFRPDLSDGNLWRRFTRHELRNPGRAECGNVHFAPNSVRDYDWGNPRRVLSRCRNWRNFPDLSREPVWVDREEWGGGDIRAHHRWWLSLLPHMDGAADGVDWNWWRYVADVNAVRRVED